MGDVKGASIVDLFNNFKSDKEKEEFIQMQVAMSVDLMKKVKALEEENGHLKQLLSGAVPLIGESSQEITKIIVTPEEALIDAQINILESRGRSNYELTLEEVKKLDLLIKNKKIIKEDGKTIQAESKPVKGNFNIKDLAKIASLKKDDDGV